MTQEDHPLKQWLRRQSLRNGFASKRLDVRPTTLSRYFMGAREMKIEIRIAVERMTEGQVTRSDIEDWQAAHLKRLAKRKKRAHDLPDADLGLRPVVVFGPQRGELFLRGVIDLFKGA